MKISVRVKPNSKQEKVQECGDNKFIVWVRAAAREGKANQALLEALSDYFDLPKSRIHVICGHSGREKIVSLE